MCSVTPDMSHTGIITSAGDMSHTGNIMSTITDTTEGTKETVVYPAPGISYSGTIFHTASTDKVYSDVRSLYNDKYYHHIIISYVRCV